jgi:sugar phosphate permease
MPMGILFWIILILCIIAVIFGSAWPLASWGILLVLLFLLGWKVFGPPLQ